MLSCTGTVFSSAGTGFCLVLGQRVVEYWSCLVLGQGVVEYSCCLVLEQDVVKYWDSALSRTGALQCRSAGTMSCLAPGHQHIV